MASLPNGPMEIVFSFDTTGSMNICLDEVRSRVADLTQRLQADIPGIKIAIFAHGDYCDKSTYVTKYVDFTDNVVDLCEFVKSAEGTGGGDADECYELVLYEVRTKLSWTPGSQRALVMIGDANPHEPNYPLNKLKLDWRKEADSLGAIGVRIYSVQCRNNGSDGFYGDIAKRTGGQHLRLEDFKNIFDFLMAVCYRERGADFLESYEKEVRARCGPVHKDLNVLFGGLRDAADGPSSSKADPKPKEKTSKTGKPSSHILTKKVVKSPHKKTRTLAKAFKGPKRFVKYETGNLPKLQREKVPQNNFLLGEMPWSKWHLAISPKECDVTPRSRVDCGYRASQIFKGDTKIPALYEVAVQTKTCGKKFVVLTKYSKLGFVCGKNWERKLFGKAPIRSQLNTVVKNGCSVFIRRAPLKVKNSNVKVCYALNRYDYAWNANREVVKNYIKISSDMEVDA